MTNLRKALSIILVLWSVLYVSHILDHLGFMMPPLKHQAIFLGLLLFLTFLIYPARKTNQSVKWYDWVLVVMSVVPTGYVVVFYRLWQIHGATEPESYEIVLFIVLLIALIEALRRSIGMILSVITLMFTVYPLICNSLPGILSGRIYSLDRITSQFYLPEEGIFSLPLNVAATIVVMFVLFGQILIVSGAGETIMNFTLSFIGRVRGGPAKAAVVASSLFGTLNSSVSANVATTGVFTIPMMKSIGYRPAFAAGVEACSSNGGHLTPPVMGVVAFVMAEWLQIPYVQVCYAAFLPAILYYICMFLQVDFEAARQGIKGLPSAQLPSLKATIKAGWLHVIPVIILVFLLFGIHSAPETAVFWSTLCVLATGVLKRDTRLNLSKIMNGTLVTARIVIIPALTCAMAGLIMASLSLTGVTILLSAAITKVAGDSLFLLLVLAALTSFAFGMGMTSLPCYIFVALFVAPALTQTGIPELAAHLFVFWLAIGSFITPPVCVSAYVAAAIAEAPPMKVGVWATRIGIALYIVPFAFIYNLGLLLHGSTGQIASAIIFCLIGIVAIAAGLEGFLLSQAGWVQRTLFLIGGIMMFSPSWEVRVLGATAIAIPVLVQIYGRWLSRFRKNQSIEMARIEM
jgi:TRAP transporter 4TM/12TM fusion protein